jgi:hypothetical protein
VEDFAVSEGLVDDLLIFGKPFSNIARVDHDERMGGGKLQYLLLLLLDGNPCFQAMTKQLSFETN